MKKKFIIIVIIVCICVGVIIILNNPTIKLIGKGTPKLEKTGNIILIIKKKKDCVPVSLYLYDDGTYELFTEYEDCVPFKECTLRLNYTKSIKGTYEYDLTKILDDNVYIYDDNILEDDIDYEILSASSLGDGDYIIKKGEENKALAELLKNLDCDLDICAIPNYV